MEIKKLNEIQEKQLFNILSFYKHFYICNDCGSVYGSDLLEQKYILCPNCELIREQKKKKK